MLARLAAGATQAVDSVTVILTDRKEYPARIVGRETVDYVGNIYKYYVVYKLAEQKLRERAKASQQPGS